MSFLMSHYAGKSEDYFDGVRTEIAPLLPVEAKKVLEIGCGAGQTMRWLRGIRDVTRAVGIELLAEPAALAGTVFDEVLVGQVEARIEDLPNGSFDLVIALDVLEHLIDPWDIVRKCVDRLKPGGTFVASVPNVSHYSVVFPLLFRGRWTYRDNGLLDVTHLRFFEARSAISLMTGSGCVLDQVRKVRLTPTIINRIPDHRGGRRIRWYTQKILGWIPPCHLLDFQYLISVRKSARSMAS